jgi:cell division protein ZipA
VDWLRISLLVLGVILVAGIWITHRARARGRREARALEMDDWGDDTGVHIRAHREDHEIEPSLGNLGGDLDHLLESEAQGASAPPFQPELETPAVQPAPEPVVRAKPETRPESSPKPKLEPRPEPKAEPAPEPRMKSRREPKLEPRPEPKAEPQPEPRAEPRPEPRMESRREDKTARPASPPQPPPAPAKAASLFSSVTSRFGRRQARDSDPDPGHAGQVVAARGPAPARPALAEHFDDVSEPRVVGRNPRARGRDRDKILVLHVVAPRNRPFTGVALGAALRRAGLKLGEMSIYHYRDEAASDQDHLFSVANMVPPGTLTDEDLADMMTPGVTLFLQLNACERPHRAFEALLVTSHTLARDLGGRIMDAQQSTATNQTLAHMREDMNQWLLHNRPELLRRKADS